MRNYRCGSTVRNERGDTEWNGGGISPRTFGERRSISERHQRYYDKQKKSAEARHFFRENVRGKKNGGREKTR